MISLKRNNINNDLSFSQQKSSVFFLFGASTILFSFQNKTLIMSRHLVFLFICLMYRKIKWVVYVHLHKQLNIVKNEVTEVDLRKSFEATDTL